MKTRPDRTRLLLRLTYAGTLGAWVVASGLPGVRVWGLGFLSPLSLLERIAVVICALALGFWIERRGAHGWDAEPRTGVGLRAGWLWWAAPVLAGALFVLLRGTTHFLGDGAARLTALATARLRGGLEFSLTLPMLQAARSLWPEGETALRAYQTVSVAAGVLCVAAVLYYGRRIFGAGMRAWVYAAGLLSAGYMLVFFGYVENHALLILAVVAFASAGVALCKKRASLWSVTVIFVLAVGVDALGWSLLPAFVYLVVTQSPLSSHWRRLSLWVRWGTGLALAAVLLTVIVRLYNQSHALQLAVLSLFKNRLTVDGYTLLSVAHLLDLLNLLILIFRGWFWPWCT